MGRAMAPVMNLQVLPLAAGVAPVPLVMAWLPRHHADQAHTLLRQGRLRLLAAARGG